MSLTFRLPAEILLVLFAGVVAISAMIWAWRMRAEVRAVVSLPVAAELPADEHGSAERTPPARGVRHWPDPVAQSQGPGWIYEIFTPPDIYYHPALKSFTVTPPRMTHDAGERIFGLELIGVGREPFRLQLLGYVGRPGDYIATFVSRQVPETLLARPGHHFESLDLRLKDFAVRRVPAEGEADSSLHDVAAIAVLEDERTGGEVVLDSRTRLLTDTPFAVLRFVGMDRTAEFQQGDAFQHLAATYRIESIQLDPPEVLVARHTTDLPYPETRTLKPAGGAPVAHNNALTARRFETESADGDPSNPAGPQP